MGKVVLRGAQPILVVDADVHRNRGVPLRREAIAHPTIAGAQVQNPQASIQTRTDVGQNLVLQIMKRARTNRPLAAVATGKVAVGQGEVVLGFAATAALLFSDELIIFYK